MILTEEVVVSYVFEIEIHSMASLFYVDDVLITPKCLYRIQWDADALTGIFEWVGLWENYGKIVGLVFQICHIFVSNYDTEYGLWMMGEGEKLQDQQ